MMKIIKTTMMTTTVQEMGHFAFLADVERVRTLTALAFSARNKKCH